MASLDLLTESVIWVMLLSSFRWNCSLERVFSQSMAETESHLHIGGQHVIEIGIQKSLGISRNLSTTNQSR
jgi:hypothetical protein